VKAMREVGGAQANAPGQVMWGWPRSEASSAMTTTTFCSS